MKFRTTIVQSGPTTTGIQVPDEVIEALGAGRKPPVRITINGYSYRSTVATMDGNFMVSLSSAHRAASGLAGGDEVEVDIEVDDFAARDRHARRFRCRARCRAGRPGYVRRPVEQLKRYHVDLVNGAKTDETRQRRIERSVATLKEGKPR